MKGLLRSGKRTQNQCKLLVTLFIDVSCKSKIVRIVLSTVKVSWSWFILGGQLR